MRKLLRDELKVRNVSYILQQEEVNQKGDEIMKRTTLYALLISTTLLVGICYAGSAPKAAEKDIVDTAVAAGNFKI